MTLSRAASVALLADHGLSPKRKFGQNFLVDANTLAKIVRLSGVTQGDRVIEFGPGLGALTEQLLAVGVEVRAVEIDPDLIAILRERPELAAATFIEADAMEVDLDDLAPPSGGPYDLVANLPYNVATPLVMRVLREAPQIRSIFVMVQLEVAQRLGAGPGDEAYGSVSARLRYWASAKLVGKVPATVFVPAPKVASGLVRIVRLDQLAVDPGVASAEKIERIVTMAFGQRRKMLRRSLHSVLSEADFAAAGVDSSRRPEELDIQQFGALAGRIS